MNYFYDAIYCMAFIGTMDTLKWIISGEWKNLITIEINKIEKEVKDKFDVSTVKSADAPVQQAAATPAQPG